MRLFSKLCTALLCVSLPLGCGGSSVSDLTQDPGVRALDLKAADLTGTWNLTTTAINTTTCSSTTGRTAAISIAVSGTTVTLTEAGQSNVVLTIKGSRVQGTSSKTTGSVRAESTWDFGAIGGRIDGTVNIRNVNAANGQLVCTEDQSISGYRSSLVPVASLVGNWRVTLTTALVAGNCSNEIGATEVVDVKIELVNGALRLTLGSTPFDTSVAGNRLQGAVTLNGGALTFDIGAVDATTFEGTFAAGTTAVGLCSVTQAAIGQRI
ncbi:MAG: hypothetical protein WAT39_07490 [Planctomycetota bacterium]